MLGAIRRASDERGSILAMVALFIPVMLIMAVFVIDVTNWWTHKRHLQLQADAAALAGGDLFGECFAPGTRSAAYGDMQNEATRYGGGEFNATSGQFGGGNEGSGALAFNANTGGSDDTVEGDACDSGMFDVKATESNLPLFLGSIAGFDVVPAIHAHARVQLFAADVFTRQPPLAIPDVNPKYVFVTVWNMTTGGSAATYALSGPSASNGLSMWSAGGIVPPATSGDATIGVRVGMGQVGPGQGAACAPGNGGGGPGWTCFDGSNANTPLAVLRSYPGVSGGSCAPTRVNPCLDAATETTCSGSPFFSARNGDCAASIQTTVRWGDCALTHATCQFFVRAKDQDGTSAQVPVTASATGQTVTIVPAGSPYAPGDGQEGAEIQWMYQLTPNSGYTYSGTPCTGEPKLGGGSPNPCNSPWTAFPPTTPTWTAGGNKSGRLHQEAYSGDLDPGVSGPIEVLSISPCCSYQQSSPPSLTITVGLTASLASLSVPSQPIFLRLSSGARSKTSMVDCDDGQSIADQWRNGCLNDYQVNTLGICPDSVSPADCISLQPGSGGITIKNALDDRYSTCPAVNWPSYQPDDPRLVQMMLTDLSAYLDAQPGTKVPITNIGGFYITGWGFFTPSGGRGKNSSKNIGCPGVNQAPPTGYANSTSQAGFAALWGYFVKYINPNDRGDDPCDPNNIVPCVPTLTR